MTDAGKSIKTKLWNIAVANKRDKNDNQIYQLLAIRYVQERLLYRLSISRYREKFCLKGGALLYAYDRLDSRPTVDIDFLGKNISNNIDVLKGVFAEITAIDSPYDGITFDADKITAEEITVNKEYHGIRLTLVARLDTMVQSISMDVGFGDVITPAPQTIDYPILIQGLPIPSIFAYSLETVVAEKFEAMVTLAADNSRMKDYFDVYRILKFQKLDLHVLKQAIKATFANRNTQLEENHLLFRDDFANDYRRNSYWKGFLKRIKWKEDLDFKDVWTIITINLKKYYDSLLNN
ncbi:MAG: nucleotidyl transferase AbiEii/AbiGii toxin family protein [Prevotella sp.]|nr:nucleotidyl transferase AbiEii/AbiGii toxin family protein [Prevotella sp.]